MKNKRQRMKRGKKGKKTKKEDTDGKRDRKLVFLEANYHRNNWSYSSYLLWDGGGWVKLMLSLNLVCNPGCSSSVAISLS